MTGVVFTCFWSLKNCKNNTPVDGERLLLLCPGEREPRDFAADGDLVLLGNPLS